MLSIIRWLLFLPAAFVAAVVASFLFTIGGRIFNEFMAICTGGAMGAVAFVMAGLWVAPRRSNAVKWTLIIISAILGILSAIGAMLGDDDKMKVFAGVFMAIFSFLFARVSPDQITKAG